MTQTVNVYLEREMARKESVWRAVHHDKPGETVKKYRHMLVCLYGGVEIVPITRNYKAIAHVKGAYIAKLIKHTTWYKFINRLGKMCRNSRRWFPLSHKTLVALEESQFENQS